MSLTCFTNRKELSILRGQSSAFQGLIMYVESFMRGFDSIAIRTLSNLSPQPPPRIIVLIVIFCRTNCYDDEYTQGTYKLGSVRTTCTSLFYIIAQIEFPGEAGASGER